MEFKIETRDTYLIITPVAGVINAILADNFVQKVSSDGQIGSCNLIIDLSEVGDIDSGAIDVLVDWHESAYSQNISLVFTQPQPQVMKALKRDEKDLLINIAPKMIEAIDIISMEILERDLLGEE